MTTQEVPTAFFGRALSNDFHRWSRWYPARWRVENSAAMLGTYLDAAETEGRQRLRFSDKMALVNGGIEARVNLIAPAVVRDWAATIALTLLGTFGFVVGLLFEWAPWATQSRIQYLERYWLIPKQELSHYTFGPFLSPFFLICPLAVMCLVLGFIGPRWLARSVLILTALGGIVLAAIAHYGVGEFYLMSTYNGIFVTVVALTALLGRPARKRILVAITGAWIVSYFLDAIVWSGYHLASTWILLFSGYPVSNEGFFDGSIITVDGCIFFVFAAAVATLVLVLCRCRRAAAVVALSTVPWVLSPLANAPRELAHWSFVIFGGFLLAAVIAVRDTRTRTAPSDRSAALPNSERVGRE